jgi:uncharacterized HAD superfamily protein
MKIGIDFGGVVIDVAPVKAKLIRELFDLEVDPGHVVEPNLDPRLSLERYHIVQNYTYGTSALLDAPAVTGAQSGVKQLMRQGHEVSFVSNLQAPGIRFGRQWLIEHELDASRFISVGVGGDKRMVVQHGFDMYIDARSVVLGPLVGIVPHLLLFKTRYNAAEVMKAPIVRAEDWAELLAWVGHADKLAYAHRA